MKLTKEGIAIIETDTHISKWVEESGRLDHDQNILPLVLPFIPEGGTVLDIGANIGSHTVAYANRVGNKGAVYAFEPNKIAFKCLEYNTKDYNNIQIFECAIGETWGACEIKNNSENLGMAFIELSEKGICISPLDAFSGIGADNFIKKCDFIKIDVEGYELEVLKGAKETIKKYFPVMLIEVNKGCLERNGESKESLFKLLDEYGYYYRNIYQEQGMDDVQFDILCRKK